LSPVPTNGRNQSNYSNIERSFSTYILELEQLEAIGHRKEDGFKMWQSLVRQTELIAQLCSIMKDIKKVSGGTQKKIDKLRQLLSGLLSELTYFDEVLISFFYHSFLNFQF
jgi:phosphatidylinositol 3-kinase